MLNKVALLALLAPSFALAAVQDMATGGFTVRLDLHIAATPDLVYTRLVNNIGEWWDPIHTFSGNSHFLTIDDQPAGCFCERRPNAAGGVRHMEVVNVDRGKILVLSGALGPLQFLAATGTLTLQFTSEGAGTKLTAVYRVAGYLEKGMDNWAIPVDQMLTGQFTRLKNYVETGKPENEKAAPK